VERQQVGWMYQILPYIEMDHIYKIVSNDASTASGPLSRSLIPLYFCPSRRAPFRNPSYNRCPNDYAGAIPGFKSFPGDEQPFWWADGYDHEGIFARLWSQNNTRVPLWGPKITYASIIDGSSNTFIVGEKWLRPDRYTGNDWMDDQGWLCGWDPDIIRMTSFKLFRDFIWDANSPAKVGFADEWRQGFAFGGNHVSGMNALCGDGSVRHVSFKIDETVWWRIGNRKDGTALDADSDAWRR
jgi:hypothetical protein